MHRFSFNQAACILSQNRITIIFFKYVAPTTTILYTWHLVTSIRLCKNNPIFRLTSPSNKSKSITSLVTQTHNNNNLRNCRQIIKTRNNKSEWHKQSTALNTLLNWTQLLCTQKRRLQNKNWFPNRIISQHLYAWHCES